MSNKNSLLPGDFVEVNISGGNIKTTIIRSDSRFACPVGITCDCETDKFDFKSVIPTLDTLTGLRFIRRGGEGSMRLYEAFSG
jgi:hypothetical protein